MVHSYTVTGSSDQDIDEKKDIKHRFSHTVLFGKTLRIHGKLFI